MAGELHRCAVDGDFRQTRIERNRSPAKLRRHLATGPTDQRPQSREQLFDAERLRHVIVGSAVDALYLLMPAAPCGEHQYRNGVTGLTPLPDERQAIDLRQPEVEHDGVIALGVGEEVGLLAVARAIDRIAGILQRFA